MTTADLQNLARSMRAMPPSARRLVEEAIELLLLACDEMDGDPNLEEEPDREEGGDAEPSLGWTDMEARYGCRGEGIGGPDREDDAVDEPSLGATEDLNQNNAWRNWRAAPDLEDEHDGREPGEDEEHSLGWGNVMLGVYLPASRVRWTAAVWEPGMDQTHLGLSSDLELDDCDREEDYRDAPMTPDDAGYADLNLVTWDRSHWEAP